MPKINSKRIVAQCFYAHKMKNRIPLKWGTIFFIIPFEKSIKVSIFVQIFTNQI